MSNLGKLESSDFGSVDGADLPISSDLSTAVSQDSRFHNGFSALNPAEIS